MARLWPPPDRLWNLFSNEPEEEYAQAVSLETRKQTGQFFTPYSIARFMARWLDSNPQLREVLDPACGLGVFARSLTEVSAKELNIRGYDTDHRVLNAAAKVLSRNGDNCQLVEQDYLLDGWEESYDGIISNPPYIRFQDFKGRERVLADLQARLGHKLSGFTNIYALFLLKSIRQLREGGRAAYLIPSEFLNAGYGKIIKEALIQSRMLRYIIIFNVKTKIFSDVLTTSSILLLARDRNINEVTFLKLQSELELEELGQKLAQYPQADVDGVTINNQVLDPGRKWRHYYQKNSPIRSQSGLVPLQTYGRVVRGIATGANDYFTLNLDQARQYGIPAAYLLPCITKSAQVKGAFFTPAKFQELAANSNRVYLLNATDLQNQRVREYISHGEHLGVNQRYLTRHRRPWYSLENRAPAPVWVQVFNRGGVRFVRNEAGVRNLTTFHGFYLHPEAAAQADLLFAYLLTPGAQEILAENRREYGNGLEKVEPSDLNHGLVVDLDRVRPGEEREILNLYRQYRASCLAGPEDSSVMEKVNSLFLSILNRS